MLLSARVAETHPSGGGECLPDITNPKTNFHRASCAPLFFLFARETTGTIFHSRIPFGRRLWFVRLRESYCPLFFDKYKARRRIVEETREKGSNIKDGALDGSSSPKVAVLRLRDITNCANFSSQVSVVAS